MKHPFNLRLVVLLSLLMPVVSLIGEPALAGESADQESLSGDSIEVQLGKRAALMQKEERLRILQVKKNSPLPAAVKVDPKEEAIREAVAAGDVPMIEKLLNEGVSPDLGLDKENPYDNWPLVLQAARTYPQRREMLKLLIARGAQVRFVDSNQNTLLHLVADPEILELLIKEGIEVGAANDQHDTPLHVRAEKGDVEAVRVLLSHKASPNARNESGLTPLALALRGPIDQRPADGPAPDFERETPRYLEVIRLLLEAGADATGPFKVGPDHSSDQEEGYKKFRKQALRLIKTFKNRGKRLLPWG